MQYKIKAGGLSTGVKKRSGRIEELRDTYNKIKIIRKHL